MAVDRRVPSILTRNAAPRLGFGHDYARGFSILEILVAFTLLALAMGILMQIFSRGVNGAGLADQYAKATMMAESKLATVGIESVLQEGETTGKFDASFQWRLQVTPFVDPTPKDPTALAANGGVDIESLMAVKLFDVSLTVSFQSDDNRDRQVTLNTLLIGGKT